MYFFSFLICSLLEWKFKSRIAYVDSGSSSGTVSDAMKALVDLNLIKTKRQMDGCEQLQSRDQNIGKFKEQECKAIKTLEASRFSGIVAADQK